MHFKLCFIFAAIWTASVLGSSSPDSFNSTSEVLKKKSVLRFNPSVEDVAPRSLSLDSPQELSLTNAKRFAMGLPPKPPRRLPTASESTPHARPSSYHRKRLVGCLHVRDASDGRWLGYLSRNLNAFGEYGPTTYAAQRLMVKVDTAAEGPINVATMNGQETDLPYMVGITGFANDASGLHPGNYNYVYLGAGGRTAANVSPRAASNSFTRATGNAEAIESMIFVLEPALNIVPFWINGDGSRPITFLGLFEGVLFITGDQNKFEQTFGPATWVTLTFEPDFN
ncbi:hypothetical protein GYMLUDRAFT_912941 [Collybiopsis luxurians FD-317 M1]|nr:hypothetical protein GYMLUDRAFT_912941 [Collybiopsis luxurians FD-317 M1]